MRRSGLHLRTVSIQTVNHPLSIASIGFSMNYLHHLLMTSRWILALTPVILPFSELAVGKIIRPCTFYTAGSGTCAHLSDNTCCTTALHDGRDYVTCIYDSVRDIHLWRQRRCQQNEICRNGVCTRRPNTGPVRVSSHWEKYVS